ncbi:hypothetical protein COV11_03490 [Candidatus Woesearchaeota archaeon CG10_big_fil_rev_8_21_14_0_10_30_7]|nr:MAG: hypothetical protein COV11_03490 [Candidatus Woesearchaeota archaeon CG10_big_fil_rev_8_21_14_0_10_30_7]
MELTILLILLTIFSVWIFIKRKKFSFHGKFPFVYFGMYRTNWGIKLMDVLVKKYPKLLKLSCSFAIITGFLGMILVSYDILKTIYKIIFVTKSVPTVGLVLPIKATGVFYVPLIYWIIVLAFLAIIHEFAHGVIARLYNVKIKSTGFAFLGILIPIIPAAFVEPDEKKLEKKTSKEQLSIFAAGPFINIVCGLLFMLLFFQVLTPLSAELYNYNGLEITGLFGGETPAKLAGLSVGEIIQEINGVKLETISDFKRIFEGKIEGEMLNLVTNNGIYEITLGNEGLLGVFVEENKNLINAVWYNQLLVWFKDLIYWMFILNLGVGLFNLIPIGPIDGGRMLHVVLQKILPHKHARRIWYSVSAVFLVSILGSVLVSFI